ncbi:hypothetical protein [Sorangium sp. So ce388]|uniref:hypothetical protein n=1 Tax=Sorangium sp. So ce388 TaxID=3133309 RepID=UPI003F5C673F
MADQDIVLRDPGGGAGAISFGGGPAPVTGTAATSLPALGASGVGQLVFVGVAAVALPALAADGEGALTFSGGGAAALSALAADGDGLQVFAGAAAVALPALASDAAGALVFAGSGAATLPGLAAGAAGALGFLGVAAPLLPALAAAADGSSVPVFTGTAAVGLPALAGAAAGALRFVGAGAATLPALVVDADGSIASPGDDRPAFLTLPRAGALYELALPAVGSLYAITLTRPMARLHIGDTALIAGITIRDRDGDLVDPSSLTVHIRTPLGVAEELVYGVAPTSGSGDAVIRTAAGTFDLQIEITEVRGAGMYEYTVVTTGARAAEPGSFKVYERSV